MARHCALDLWAPSSADLPSPDSGNSTTQRTAGNSQQLTIFYDGRVSVSDATEKQARAILELAKQEMEASYEKDRRDVIVTSENKSRKVALPLYGRQQPQQQFQPPGLCMKRSLQRFLQKRKNRSQESSPYNH